MSGYPKAHWRVLPAARVEPIVPGKGTLVQRFLLWASRRQARARKNLNVVATFLRMDDIFPRHLLLVSQLLMKGSLARADKERIVLRVGWRMGSLYEWSAHVPLGLTAGLSRQEIESFASEDCAGWSTRTRCFVDATDELIDSRTLSEGAWNRLRQQLTDAQAMEFCMLVGHYVMVAMTANTLGVRVEEEFLLGPLPKAIEPGGA